MVKENLSAGRVDSAGVGKGGKKNTEVISELIELMDR